MISKPYHTFLASMLCASIFPICAQVNTLSPQESQAGYDLLFNGKDLNNWHAYRSTGVNTYWTVETNAPLGPRIQNHSGSWEPILSNKTYKNFDMKVEIAPGVASNSGIFFRYQEIATNYGNARSGPEMQICAAGNSDCDSPLHKFGAVYDMFPVNDPVRNTWDKPAGQWNEVRVVAFDSNYVHYGNDLKLVEYKIGSPAFIAAYNASKYSGDGNNGNYYNIHFGSILLQNHNEPTPVSFRNLRIRELKVNPLRQEFKDGVWPATLPLSYVFGKRGCMDNLAKNYDPTAEVSDSSCIAVTLIEKRIGKLKVASRKLSEGVYSVTLTDTHSDFSVYTVAGQSIAFQKSDLNGYVFKSPDKTGFLILKFRLGGTPVSRLISIQ